MRLKLLIVFTIWLASLSAQTPYSGEKAYQYLLKQVRFGPRIPGTAAHEQCKEYLVKFFRDLGYPVEVQSFFHVDSRTGKTVKMANIIVKINPEKKKRLLLCAHWDTRPFADEETGKNRNQPFPGANDGASGVAVLMHLAEVLQHKETAIGIDIVLFDGEDFGSKGNLNEYFLGSRYYVNYYTGIFPRYAILLDMVGDRNLNVKKEGYSMNYAPWLVDLIWNKALELGYDQFENTRGPYIEDDHVVLNKKGIPAVDIIDFEYPDVTNSYWHTLKDTPEHCAPQSLEVVGDLLFRLILDTNWMRY